jgi:hypothetical protein
MNNYSLLQIHTGKRRHFSARFVAARGAALQNEFLEKKSQLTLGKLALGLRSY